MKISELIYKKLNGTLLKKEELIFNNWLAQSKENQEIFFFLKELFDNGEDVSGLLNWDEREAWKKVMTKYREENIKIKSKSRRSSFMRYAAVLVGLLFIGYAGYYFSMPFEQSEKDSNVITLELGNGEVKTLSTFEEYAVGNNSEIVHNKKGNGQINYKGAVTDKIVYNKLSVPYGKRFEIILSDGTRVHLNAGTSIRFPVKFLEGQNRHVFLDGEAFFDVTEDKKHPFIVSANRMNITVFGTEFNVAAYPEDKFVSTVLVKGSVGISDSIVNQDKMLRLHVGEKADWDKKSGEVSFEKVETNIYTSWIDGRIVFKKVPFSNILRKLERHYNVKIENKYPEIETHVFTASFDKEGIDEVLASFAMTRKFSYEITENKIIINPPK